MKRHIITGGLGFLGSHLALRLARRGDHVAILDLPEADERLLLSMCRRDETTTPGAVCEIHPSQEQVVDDRLHRTEGRIVIVRGNAVHGHDLTRAFAATATGTPGIAGLDRIWSFACYASPDRYKARARDTLDVCAFGTRQAAMLAEQTGAKVVLASTSEVYGDPTEHPQRESYRGNVDPVGPRSCFDAETEVLTRRGWVPFPKLLDSDSVATWREDGLVEYHVPQEVIRQWHRGPMLHFRSSKLDMLLTPDHRVVNLTADRKKVRVDRASDPVSWGRRRIPVSASFDAVDIDQFIPGPPPSDCKTQLKPIPMDHWLEFLGYFLSEGCIYERTRSRTANGVAYETIEYRILISQQKQSNREPMLAAARRLGLRVHEQGEHPQFVITSKHLASLLPKGKSADKRLPREYLALSCRQSEILFRALMLGDGHWLKGGSAGTYSTSSPGLADDVQELAMRAGWTASIRNDKVNGHYFVNLRKRAVASCPMPTTEQYDGLVYCVSVQNQTVIVRRGGKAYVSGNCYDEGKRYAEAYLTACLPAEQRAIVRIFNTVGPCSALDGRMIPSFIRQALVDGKIRVQGDGRQTRSPIYVTDLLDGIEAVVAHGDGDPYNVGGEEEMSVGLIAANVRSLLRFTYGREVDVVIGGDRCAQDPERRLPDLSRVRTCGWKGPRLLAGSAIDRAASWLVDNAHRWGLPSIHRQPGAAH